MDNYFEAKNISFNYKGQPFCLKNINLKIKKGEKILILASEGMGKTAFLSVFSSFFDKYSGNLYLKGKNLKEIDDREKHFSLLPSKPIFIENKSILKNFELFLKQNKIDNYDKEKFINDFKNLMLKCKITEKIKKITQFDKKILSLYRSKIKNPDILFLDDQFENIKESEVDLIKNHYIDFINNKDLTMFFAIGENTFKTNQNFIKNLKIDNILYIFNSDLIEFANFNEFENKIINFNQFEFIAYKNIFFGNIIKSQEKFYLIINENQYCICDEINSLIISSNKLCEDEEEIILVCYKEIAENLNGNMINKNLQTGCYLLFSKIGGEKLF